MPLESLLELVKTLSDRIDQHGAALRQSEALTRYALIDPLLRELGWDTSDPDMVIPEYRSGNGRADYALMNNGSPAMMVEAKRLGTPLQDSVLSQGINYCIMEGTSYFSVTDGRIWEIYEPHKPVPIHDKRIVQFDIKGNPAQVCLKALALWRLSMGSGDIPTAQPSVVEPTHPQPSSPETEIAHIPARTDEIGWLPLSELSPRRGDQAPSEILFPDNSTVQIRYWNSMLVEATKWLIGKNLLGPNHCPVPYWSARTRSISSSRYVVNTEPKHVSDSRRFKRPVQVGQLYIETDAGGATTTINTRLVIETAGQDPAQFKVRLP